MRPSSIEAWPGFGQRGSLSWKVQLILGFIIHLSTCGDFPFLIDLNPPSFQASRGPVPSDLCLHFQPRPAPTGTNHTSACLLALKLLSQLSAQAMSPQFLESFAHPGLEYVCMHVLHAFLTVRGEYRVSLDHSSPHFGVCHSTWSSPIPVAPHSGSMTGQ